MQAHANNLTGCMSMHDGLNARVARSPDSVIPYKAILVSWTGKRGYHGLGNEATIDWNEANMDWN